MQTLAGFEFKVEKHFSEGLSSNLQSTRERKLQAYKCNYYIQDFILSIAIARAFLTDTQLSRNFSKGSKALLSAISPRA